MFLFVLVSGTNKKSRYLHLLQSDKRPPPEPTTPLIPYRAATIPLTVLPMHRDHDVRMKGQPVYTTGQPSDTAATLAEEVKQISLNFFFFK